MTDRIDGLAVAPQFEMQVWAGRATGIADEADQVAPLHVHAGRDTGRERREMAIEGRKLFLVLYVDIVAIAAVGCRASDDALGGRINGRSWFGGEIDTLVHYERCAPGDGAGRRSRCAT